MKAVEMLEAAAGWLTGSGIYGRVFVDSPQSQIDISDELAGMFRAEAEALRIRKTLMPLPFLLPMAEKIMGEEAES